MKPREQLPTHTSPREAFFDEIKALERSSLVRRDELTRTRLALARRTGNPDILQLAAALEDVRGRLGEDRADIMWFSILWKHLPPEMIVTLWKEKDALRRESDKDTP